MKNLIITFILLLLTASYAGNTRLWVYVQNQESEPVEDAYVSLYATEEDYRASENAVEDSVLTDHKGRVKFSKLTPEEYYVDVFKGKLSNRGYEAKTEPLESGRVNKIMVLIE